MDKVNSFIIWLIAAIPVPGVWIFNWRDNLATARKTFLQELKLLKDSKATDRSEQLVTILNKYINVLIQNNFTDASKCIILRSHSCVRQE